MWRTPSWQWSRHCTVSPWTHTAWPCWLAPTEPSSPSTSSPVSPSATEPVPCVAPFATCPHCLGPPTSPTGATLPWGCPTPLSGYHRPRTWPPCCCARPLPRRRGCRRRCCCVWVPETGASAPRRRWSSTGCCGPGGCP